LPLAIAAQRLLGDVGGKTVVVPNIWDGALAAFLPADATIKAYQAQKSSVGLLGGLRKEGDSPIEVVQGVFSAASLTSADAVICNFDPRIDELGQREDYRLALSGLRHMRPGARAVFIFLLTIPIRRGKLLRKVALFMKSWRDAMLSKMHWRQAPICLAKTVVSTGCAWCRCEPLRQRQRARKSKLQCLPRACLFSLHGTR